MTRNDRRQFLQQMAGGMAALALTPEWLPAAARPRKGAPLSVGIVGAGKRGRDVLTELAKMEGVQVAALADVRDVALRRAGRRAPDAAAFPDHGAMLEGAPELEAVVVATPTHRHRQVVEDAVAAGKHVYCEAPLAHTLEDAQALARLGSRSAQVFQVGHTARSNPVYRLARSFVRSGTLRDLLYLRVQCHERSSWRTATSNPADEAAANWKLDPAVSLGLVGEMASHSLDAVHWFTGLTATQVRGSGAVLAYPDGRQEPDTVQCAFALPDRRQLHLDATLGNSFEDSYEQFVGTMGTIKMAQTHGWLFKEADAPVQGWEVYASRQKFHNEVGITLIADATKLAAQGADLTSGIGLPEPPLYYALQDFLKSITEQAEVACTAADGLRAAGQVIAAHQAVLEGSSVAIDPASLELS